MRNKVSIVLIVLLLVGGFSCPAALADGPPGPSFSAGSGRELRDETPTQPTSLEKRSAPEQLADTPSPGEDPTQAQPSNTLPPEGAGCNTIEELAELVSRNEGGKVTVTDDLLLPGGSFVALTAEAPVTIDLGSHGITVSENASLYLSGPVTLTGDGAPRPLLTIYGNLSTMYGPALTAEGESAVAVRLIGGTWSATQTSVLTAGANACAVEVEGAELDLFRVHLGTAGKSSLCLRSDSPVRLTLCEVDCSGVLAEAPSLVLDTTGVNPEPEDARIIRREAGPGDTFSENGLCLPVGATEEALAELLKDRLGNEIRYSLFDTAAEESLITESVAGTWSGGPVDLSRPGAYRFTGTPEEILGDVPLPERTVWLYVVDPGLPWLRDAERGGSSAVLRFFREIEGAESLTLWYSMDGGANWQDAAGLPGAIVSAEGAVLESLPLENHDYYFQLEVLGGPMAGKSNTLRFAYYDDRHWNGGGDWDGGDRGDQGELPPANEVVPPPTQEPDNDPPESPPRQEPDQKDAPGDRPGQESRPWPTPTPDLTSEPTAGSAPPTSILVESDQPKENAYPIQPEHLSHAEPRPSQISDTAPTPAPPESSSAAAPASTQARPAISGEATVSLTAAELQDQLAANPAGVTLLGGDLKVFVPAGLLAGGANGLAARLDGSEAGRFEVRFWIGGKEVTGFEGGSFTVTVPVESGPGTHFCTAPDGTEIAGSALPDDRAEFSLTATGAYTLGSRPAESEATGPARPTPQPSAPEEPEPLAPILALGAGALLLVGGGALLYGRRRRK